MTTQSQALTDKSQNKTLSNGVPSGNKLSELCQTSTVDIKHTQVENLTPSKDPPHKKEDSSAEDSPNLPESEIKRPETESSGCRLHNHVQNHVISLISQEPIRECVTGPFDEITSQTCPKEDLETQKSSAKSYLTKSDNHQHHPVGSSATNLKSIVLVSPDSMRGEMEVSNSERGFTHAKEDASSKSESDPWDCNRPRKRKKHQEKSKAKWPRRDGERSSDEVVSDYNNDNSECKYYPTSPSSSSLYAKNVIKKKGEVVMAWTRSVFVLDFVTHSVFCFLNETDHKHFQHNPF